MENPMNKESKTNSQGLTTRNEKRYMVIAPEGDSAGVVEANPDLPAYSKEVFPSLVLMLAHASGRKALYDGEIQLLHHAMKHFNVTTDEAMTAFWEAYADPYVSQGKIEFRHLWKHIEKTRIPKEIEWMTRAPANQKFY